MSNNEPKPPRQIAVEWSDDHWTPEFTHVPAAVRRASQTLRIWRGRVVATLFGRPRTPSAPPTSPAPVPTLCRRDASGVRYTFFPFFNHRPPVVPVMNEKRFMKQTRRIFYRRQGFTLIELLVVIAIIAILAGLLLPVLATVKDRAKVTQAKTEMTNLRAALSAYEADYHRFPAFKAAEILAADDDFTFGLPGGVTNSQVMQILTKQVSDPEAAARNPRGTAYFTAKPAAVLDGPGLNSDGEFRDPWGSPYVISVDMNADDKVYDSFYRTVGAKGLSTDSMGQHYLTGDVMIWSLGKDKDASSSNASRNKDNILSWQ